MLKVQLRGMHREKRQRSQEWLDNDNSFALWSRGSLLLTATGQCLLLWTPLPIFGTFRIANPPLIAV